MDNLRTSPRSFLCSGHFSDSSYDVFLYAWMLLKFVMQYPTFNWLGICHTMNIATGGRGFS